MMHITPLRHSRRLLTSVKLFWVVLQSKHYLSEQGSAGMFSIQCCHRKTNQHGTKYIKNIHTHNWKCTSCSVQFGKHVLTETMLHFSCSSFKRGPNANYILYYFFLYHIIYLIISIMYDVIFLFRSFFWVVHSYSCSAFQIDWLNMQFWTFALKPSVLAVGRCKHGAEHVLTIYVGFG